jgi:hypothetical protein
LLRKKLVNKETGITPRRIRGALEAPEFAEYKAPGSVIGGKKEGGSNKKIPVANLASDSKFQMLAGALNRAPRNNPNLKS